MKQTFTSDDVKAWEMLEKLRQEHNGIGGVYVYLGHDTDNVVELKDSDAKRVGYGCTGRGLLAAVQIAMSGWRFNNLVNRDTQWGCDTVDACIQIAIEEFGGKLEGIFNTAQFQTAINTDGYAELLPAHVEQILVAHPGLVRLEGGCHWLRLPCGFEKYSSPEKQGHDQRD